MLFATYRVQKFCRTKQNKNCLIKYGIFSFIKISS